MGTRFSLTDKQVRDLIAITPPGYKAQITVSFEREEEQGDQKKPANPADLVEP